MRTPDAPAMTEQDLEDAIVDARFGFVSDDIGATDEIDRILGEIAIAAVEGKNTDTLADQARAEFARAQ